MRCGTKRRTGPAPSSPLKPERSGGDGEAEDRSLTQSGFHRERTAMALDDPLGHIEAIAGPASTRLVELTDTAELEYLLHVTRVDADAVVSNAYPVHRVLG